MSWGTTLDAQLERLIEQAFVKRFPKVPIMHARFVSTSLPDPVVWEGCTIYCPDTKVFKGSNGTSWVNL